jgi:dipeptidyl aminopeptidase/acylaminoacyl peptidase
MYTLQSTSKFIFALALLALVGCVTNESAGESKGIQLAQGSKSPSSLQAIVRLPRKEVYDLAWSPDGRYLAAESGGGLGYIIWDARTGRKIRELAGSYGPWTGQGPLTFTPDSRHLIVIPRTLVKSDGQRVAFALWNVETGALDRTVTIPFDGSLKHAAAASAVDRLAVIFEGQNAARQVVIYDTRTWDIVSTQVPIPTLVGLPFGFAFSQGGDFVAMGGYAPREFQGQTRGMVWVFDATSGKEIRSIEGAHADFVSHVAFIGQGGRVISTAPQYRQKYNKLTQQYDLLRDGDPVRIWDVATGEKVASFSAESSETYSLTVSPNGRYVVFGSASAVRGASSNYRIWDLASGSSLGTLTGGVRGAAFSPDSCCFAIHGDPASGREEVVVIKIEAKVQN